MEDKKKSKKTTTKKAKVVKRTNKKETSKKKRKAFTLIELLAVIIILGILMIIAIPSVTSYINNSRKSAYVDTAKEIVSGARNIVNSGKLEMYDTGVTYYIPYDYIGTENGAKSPYGEFSSAYVGVVYDGQKYNYYWISVDETGQGVKELTPYNDLDEDDIVSDIDKIELSQKVEYTGVGNRKTVKILEKNNDGIWEWNTTTESATNNVPEEGNDVAQTAAQQIGNLSTLRNVAGAKRYYGANPDNYISFNNELWRIIGVYGNNLKIIRSGPVSNQVRDRNGSTDWDGSSLQTYLYETYYPSLSGDAQELIEENSSWIIGPGNRMSNAEDNYNMAKDYTWNGKIGIISVYEYLYALSDSCVSNLAYQINSCDNWIHSTLVNNGQIYRAWTISYGSASNINYSLLIYGSNKEVDYHGSVDPCGFTPVVYLKSNIKITEGTGSQDNPYILEK